MQQISSQVVVNASLAVRNPYVLETPMGSQMTHNKKSSMIRKMENLKIREYHFAVVRSLVELW